ncbi:MAG: hypothetical protein V4804_01445 [Pseudomonadota bacterium]
MAVLVAQANPHLRIASPQTAISLNWLDGFRHTPPDSAARDGGSGVAPGAGGGSDDWLPAASPGLLSHVMRQITLLVRDPALHPIAHANLAALDPSRWLSQRPSDIARTCGCTVGAAEHVLSLLQQAEPAGLFARSLAEFLRL